MKLRSLAALGVTVLLARAAPAQPLPAAPSPPPPAATPAPSVPPPATWGSGVTPAQPAPTGAPTPVAPAPYPLPAAPPPQGGYPQGGYPQGAYPQGGYPQGAYPQGGYPGWGSDQVPMALGPDGRPRLLPLEMPYDPDKGVPQGYRITERRRTTFAITGASVFGGLWIASAIAGGVMEDGGKYNGRHGWPMYIPVLGPFITIGSFDVSAGGATPLVFLGLGQAAGVAMFIFGMVTHDKILKYQFETTAGVKLTPVAAPLENGGFAGLHGSF